MIPLKKSTLFLTAIFLLFSATVVLADYEPVDPLPINAVTGVLPQQIPAEALQIQWTNPDIAAGTVEKYVYEWTNSTDEPVTYTGELGNLDNPLLETDTSMFANTNYDGPYWYLHIKTEYLLFASGPGISDDVYVGPFNFDDTPPTGTIALDTSVSGQTETTSSLNPVTLSLGAATDTKTVYLSNTSTRPQVGVDYAATLSHEVIEGEGSKIIYAWFEDQVGNISGMVTLSFELIAGKSMEPAGDFDMDTGESQTFSILGKGAAETFDWEIIDPDPTDVASFSGDFENVDSVTIVCDVEGSFSVRATSDDDNAVYDSGTITVVELSVPKTYSLITNVNAIVLCRTDSGYTTGAELMSAIPNCVDLARWNATLQGYESWHAVFNPFNLVIGEPYFVTVSSPTDFTISGKTPTLSYSMLTNVNAISIPHERLDITTGSQLISAISNCVDLARWNATLQGYESWHSVFNPYDVSPDEAYFVTVSTPTIWP